MSTGHEQWREDREDREKCSRGGPGRSDFSGD